MDKNESNKNGMRTSEIATNKGFDMLIVSVVPRQRKWDC
jgi:hypothetical protein